VAAAFFWANDALGVQFWDDFKDTSLPAAALVLLMVCYRLYTTHLLTFNIRCKHVLMSGVQASLSPQSFGLPSKSRYSTLIYMGFSSTSQSRLRDWIVSGLRGASLDCELYDCLTGVSLTELFIRNLAGASVPGTVREFCQTTTRANQVRPLTPEPEPGVGEDGRYTAASKAKGRALPAENTGAIYDSDGELGYGYE
jgi:hypothetical protein